MEKERSLEEKLGSGIVKKAVNYLHPRNLVLASALAVSAVGYGCRGARDVAVAAGMEMLKGAANEAGRSLVGGPRGTTVNIYSEESGGKIYGEGYRKAVQLEKLVGEIKEMLRGTSCYEKFEEAPWEKLVDILKSKHLERDDLAELEEDVQRMTKLRNFLKNYVYRKEGKLLISEYKDKNGNGRFDCGEELNYLNNPINLNKTGLIVTYVPEKNNNEIITFLSLDHSGRIIGKTDYMGLGDVPLFCTSKNVHSGNFLDNLYGEALKNPGTYKIVVKQGKNIHEKMLEFASNKNR